MSSCCSCCHQHDSHGTVDDRARRQGHTDSAVLEAIFRVQRKTGLLLCPRPTPNLAAPPPKHLVRLNIYHLVDEVTNNKLLRFGFGVFHTGVIVYGIEWSFGESVEGQTTGLFCVAPGNAAGVVFKTIDIGYTDLSPEQVDTLLHRLETEWKSDDYHVLHRNCNHFASRLCELLSTMERLEVPAWCNRAARWGDKLVPMRVATWALKQMDDYQPPPLATTKSEHPNIGELPTSVIPASWYKTPFLRRPPRFTIVHPTASQSGSAPPRRDAPPRSTVNAATLSTAHLQSTPPPPGKVDVSSPDVGRNNTGRMPILTLDSGAAPSSSRRLDDGFDAVLVPRTRAGVRMPDFNKNAGKVSNPALNNLNDGDEKGNEPRIPIPEELSGNRGAENRQPRLLEEGAAGAQMPLMVSSGRCHGNAAANNILIPKLFPPPARPGTTSVPPHVDPNRGATHAGCPAEVVATDGSKDAASEHRPVGEVVAFAEDICLVSLEEEAEPHSPQPLPSITVAPLLRPSEGVADMDISLGNESEPPALERSGMSDRAARPDDVHVLPWSASSRTLSPLIKAFTGEEVAPPQTSGQAASTDALLVRAASQAEERSGDESRLIIGELLPPTSTGTHDEVDGARALSIGGDGPAGFHLDTAPNTVAGAVAAEELPSGDHFIAATRTASFTRPSVASVYSTASGSPNSQSAGDMDTPNARTEDATVFTEVPE